MVVERIDIDAEFGALWGKIDLCGIECRAAAVLAGYDPEAYEAAIENYALGKGYHNWTDGDWYEVAEPLDFSGVSDEDR
jgi:hypothetical protein